VVIARGVLRASGTLESVLGGTDGPVTRVRAAEAERLATALRGGGLRVDADGAAAALLVRGTAPDAVGVVAAEQGIALSELVAVSRSLEDAFLELTAEAA
jgi:ABC-2 type transport system ATP-binding protein